MIATPRRLGAAFFVSAFIILALAATVLWFAMPAKVQAQTMMTVHTLHCDRGALSDPNPDLIEAGGEILDLGEVEAAAYVEATSEATRYVRNVLLRVVTFPDGDVIAVLHDGANICRVLMVNPRLHREALVSIRGDPV